MFSIFNRHGDINVKYRVYKWSFLWTMDAYICFIHVNSIWQSASCDVYSFYLYEKK